MAEARPGWRLTVPALCLLAALARAVAAAGLAVIPRDGTVFVSLSRAVAAGDLSAAWRGTQHPLLPLLAGAAGGSELANVLVAIAAGALGAPAVLRIGERLHSRAAGVVAALLYAAAPSLVRFSSAPYAEGLSVALSLWAVERALAAAERPGRGAAAGLLAGAAYLARPEALLLLAVPPLALLLRRRFEAAALLVAGFLATGGAYAAVLSGEAGRLTLSPKKPAARFVVAEEGFDAHMAEKAERTGLVRPGAPAAALETLRTLGEASSWVILLLAVPGAVLLLRRGPGRAAAILLLALLALDLLLRFRLLHLHGYLGRRHLTMATALLVPFAAGGLLLLGRRWSVLAAGVLAATLLVVAVRPRDTEKAPLREAGRWILAQAGPGARVATWRTPRIAYYAEGKDVKLQRLGSSAGEEREVKLRTLADWLALVPGRLDGETRAAWLPASPPVKTFGEGEWRVEVFRQSSR